MSYVKGSLKSSTGDHIYTYKQENPPVENRKRRTACGITSPSITYPGGYPILTWVDGYPILTWAGGVPHPDMAGRMPHPDLGGGVPCPDLARGVPLTWGWGTPLRKNMGPVQVLWDGDGIYPEGHGTSGSIMG